MTVRFKSLACLALLLLLITAASAHAGLMGVEIFVNGESVRIVSVEPDPNGAVPLDFAVGDKSYQISGNALLDIDPSLVFSFSASNFSENAQQFVFTFALPYTLGPYDTLTHEFSSTVSDFDQSGGAAVVPTNAFMSIPFIDGADVATAGLGLGCTPLDTPGFLNLVCDPLATASASVITLTDGTFGTVVAFTLSGGDSITGQGRVELVNQVAPEPVTLSLLGIGLVVLAARRRRAR